MEEVKRTILTGMKIMFNQRMEKDHAIVIEDKIIKAIIPSDMIAHHLPAKRIDYPDNYSLVPGFIDLHIHGAQGKDVMDATQEALVTISQSQAAEGVTGFLATTMTAESERIEQVLKVIPTMLNYSEGAALLGVHLEGPFIAKEKMGAQSGEHCSLPDAKLMRQWQTLANNAIKIVTLAPELQGVMSLIAALVDLNIIPSIGHTDASYQKTCAAIEAGCTQATHLFNAMRGMHQREPGAAGALLLANNVNAELIVDKHHLAPAMIDLAYRVKGKDRLLLVSDAMRAKCLGDGQYDLGGQQVTVREGKATLADGTLAGSTLQLPQAIRRVAKITGCELAEAIAMATINPARVLKIADRKGSIEVGKDADLVILNESFEVIVTIREGRNIFKREG